MRQPLVSIIIPTYNRESIVGRALDSVIGQTYEHWECIVVDDGSSDATMDVLKTYSLQDRRIQYYLRDRMPKGAPTSRNIGLEHANGDYVIFLDSDDYLLPFCLEQRVEAFEAYSDCDFLVFPMGVKKKGLIHKQDIPQLDNYLIPFLSAHLLWQTMCPIWKTSFLKQLNGFTEGYPRFNDPELMIRALLQLNVRFEVVNYANYDSVFLPNTEHTKAFVDKVYKSLLMFIPDMVEELEKRGEIYLKHHLALYLHLWFKYFYVPQRSRKIKDSLLLINLFKSEGIISFFKANSLKLRLLLYAFSIVFFKQPINKLSEKRLYR